MASRLGSVRLAGLALLAGAAPRAARAQQPADPLERLPSRALYFDWISSQYEGTTEAQALTFMDFFRWMADEYGMRLDVYLLDVGNLDDGPRTAGVGRVTPDQGGTLDSAEFRSQFPHGLAPLAEKAAGFGARLGMWMAPDGFGATPEQERARIDTLLSLVRDDHCVAFKLDAVGGRLRPGKEEVLARALEECRKVCPDLLVLNHQVPLGKAAAEATTTLWEGAETYIDVFSWNESTAPHHRAGALARPSTPGLTRRLEDHGVCLSSCLDFWDDDLVLQAFSRSSILAPEIYGNPWLLRDDEYPRLARLFGLHRTWNELLVNGLALPPERYGPFAVARGDGSVRFLALRNLTWEPARYRIALDDSIGLAKAESVALRRFHPREQILGDHPWGSEVEVEVEPFRACLLAAATRPMGELGVLGCDAEIVRDVPGRPVEMKLLAPPGTKASVQLDAAGRRFSSARLDGTPVAALLAGNAVTVEFPGTPLRDPWQRRLGTLAPTDVPPDAEALYESTCFAADSDALELRSLRRSGPTKVPEVARARDSFFHDPMFVSRGISQGNLFDGDLDTSFIARRGGGALRVDFGAPLPIDLIRIRTRRRTDPETDPELYRFGPDCVAEVSADLTHWQEVARWSGKGTIALAHVPAGTGVRYLRVAGAPRHVAEIEAEAGGRPLDRVGWRASNLLAPYHRPNFAWSATFQLDEVVPGARLAIALPGRHGNEGAVAAIRVAGRPIGANDRAVSFPSNTWEYQNVEQDHADTYFVPLTPDLAGRPFDVVVLGFEECDPGLVPEVHLTADPPPLSARELVLGQEP